MMTAKLWLSELGLRGLRRSEPSKTASTFGILAFETAKTMSLLVSLYNSLSDAEIRSLRLDIFQSEGIRYLNSSDEGFLLNLAFSEKLEDLDRVAIAVSRLGKKCRALDLQDFDRIYETLKVGSVDMLKLGFPEKEIDRKIAKIEKLISATSELYSGLAILNEMEASERKMEQWKSYSGPMPLQAKSKPDQLHQKLALQRKLVLRMRAASLWNQPLDKIVPIMARLVCNVFARICIVFGPYVSDLPHIVSDGNVLFIASSKLQFEDTSRSSPTCYASGPLERSVAKKVIRRSSGQISENPRPVGINIFRSPKPKQEMKGLWLGFGSEEKRRISRKRKPVTKEASKATLGGSGLASLYARVIVLAGRLVSCQGSVDEGMREDLYQMLPAAVRMAVNAKLKVLMRRREELRRSEVEDWREALEGIMGWLGPMAHGMLLWETERTYEQQRFDSRPTVLLLQTLYFSDREKAEAAVVELLVGLSCICRYANQSS